MYVMKNTCQVPQLLYKLYTYVHYRFSYLIIARRHILMNFLMFISIAYTTVHVCTTRYYHMISVVGCVHDKGDEVK